MKHHLLVLFVAICCSGAMAQQPSENIYQFELQLSNSENMDYRLEQRAYLIEVLDAIEEESYFDKTRLVYIIKTTTNFNVTTLKNRIESKGITVIGNIVKTDGTSSTNTH